MMMGEVISLKEAREKKKGNKTSEHSISHSSLSQNRPADNDLGDRTSRIKASLEKINRLMAELRKMSNDRGNNV